MIHLSGYTNVPICKVAHNTIVLAKLQERILVLFNMIISEHLDLPTCLILHQLLLLHQQL